VSDPSCKTCRFYQPRQAVGQPFEVGACRRYPREMDTFPRHWCGEFAMPEPCAAVAGTTALPATEPCVTNVGTASEPRFAIEPGPTQAGTVHAPSSWPPPKMDLREFVDFGYLQELNRLFLHPLGLALSIVVDDDGRVDLDCVFDDRADLDGILFAEGLLDPAKAQRVEREMNERLEHRIRALGFACEPVPVAVE
jgi:hypothetical protein